MKILSIIHHGKFFLFCTMYYLTIECFFSSGVKKFLPLIVIRENNSTTESITWSTPVANTQENNNSSMAPTSTPDVTNSTTVKTNETFSTPGDIINSTSKTQPPVTNSTEKTDISTGSTVIDENTTRSSEITSETSMSSPTETAKAKKSIKLL